MKKLLAVLLVLMLSLVACSKNPTDGGTIEPGKKDPVVTDKDDKKDKVDKDDEDDKDQVDEDVVDEDDVDENDVDENEADDQRDSDVANDSQDDTPAVITVEQHIEKAVAETDTTQLETDELLEAYAESPHVPDLETSLEGKEIQYIIKTDKGYALRVSPSPFDTGGDNPVPMDYWLFLDEDYKAYRVALSPQIDIGVIVDRIKAGDGNGKAILDGANLVEVLKP